MTSCVSSRPVQPKRGLGLGLGLGVGVGLGVGSPGDGLGAGLGIGVGLGLPPGVGLGIGLGSGSGLGFGLGLGAGVCAGTAAGFATSVPVADGVFAMFFELVKLHFMFDPVTGVSVSLLPLFLPRSEITFAPAAGVFASAGLT